MILLMICRTSLKTLCADTNPCHITVPTSAWLRLQSASCCPFDVSLFGSLPAFETCERTWCCCRPSSRMLTCQRTCSRIASTAQARQWRSSLLRRTLLHVRCLKSVFCFFDDGRAQLSPDTPPRSAAVEACLLLWRESAGALLPLSGWLGTLCYMLRAHTQLP